MLYPYKVQYGDTLSAIALRFYGNASKYHEIAEWNFIANPDLIHEGFILLLKDPKVHLSIRPTDDQLDAIQALFKPLTCDVALARKIFYTAIGFPLPEDVK